ncbi:MAG: hypothetical protein AAFY56_06310, partial [Pseudomonadota bacterium]
MLRFGMLRFARQFFGRSLVWRQVRYTLIITVSLGLILSFIQLLVDGIREERRMEAIAQGIIRLVEAPAARAAYTLDRSLAATLSESLLDLPSVLEMDLVDDRGRVLAQGQQPASAQQFRWLTNWIFGTTIDYEVKLTPAGQAEATSATASQEIGRLRVVLDTRVLAADYIARSGLLVLTSMVRTLILGVVLSLVFYWLVT